MAKAKVRKPTHEGFVFKLGTPSVSYGFSTQIMPKDPDAYWDQGVSFSAECLDPDRFQDREATVHLMGDRRLMDMTARARSDWKPKAVGWMDADKSNFEVTVSIPSDACWQVAAAMVAGTITYMTTNGPVLYRGRTTVTSISFYGSDFDLTDYTG